MKQITAFLCALFILSTLQAQSIKSAEVPTLVIDKFSFIYPDATRVSWKVKKEKYQSDFKNDKKVTSALFLSDGTLYLTSTEIKVCALPESALDFLRKDEPEAKIEDTSIIESFDGVITFKAVVDKTEFIFDWTGQYLLSNTVAFNAKD